MDYYLSVANQLMTINKLTTINREEQRCRERIESNLHWQNSRGNVGAGEMRPFELLSSLLRPPHVSPYFRD
jgi:hypothetical protein